MGRVRGRVRGRGRGRHAVDLMTDPSLVDQIVQLASVSLCPDAHWRNRSLRSTASVCRSGGANPPLRRLASLHGATHSSRCMLPLDWIGLIYTEVRRRLQRRLRSPAADCLKRCISAMAAAIRAILRYLRRPMLRHLSLVHAFELD